MNDQTELSEFERRSLEKLLEGEHRLLGALRLQLEHCRVRSRDLTGGGIFVELDVDHAVSSADGPWPTSPIRNVGCKFEHMNHPVGLMLFLHNGYLSMLEGYAYGEDWPPQGTKFELHFEGERQTNPGDIGCSFV